MISLALALALTSTWSYAGFVANPTAPPDDRPPAVPAVPPAPAVPVIPPPPEPPPRPPAPPAPPTPPPAPPTPPPAATRYRMADISGQVWEHDDPDVLRAFVLQRNALLSRPS